MGNEKKYGLCNDKQRRDPYFILSPFFIGEPMSGLEALMEGPHWYLNKPNLPNTDPQIRMAVLYKELARKVYETISDGKLPVSISGDCLSSIGVLSGLQNANITPAIIWIDAHGDFHTWETSTSGFLGGMSLAMLTSRGEQTIMKEVGLNPVSDDRVILLDGRDLNLAEKEALAASRLSHYQIALDFKLPAGPLYVNFDTDVTNPKYAPAMRYPAENGPSVDELSSSFKHLSKSGQIIAISMSSWDPDLDANGLSRKASMRLLNNLIYG